MTIRVFLARTPGGWQVMPGGFGRVGRRARPRRHRHARGGLGRRRLGRLGPPGGARLAARRAGRALRPRRARGAAVARRRQPVLGRPLRGADRGPRPGCTAPGTRARRTAPTRRCSRGSPGSSKRYGVEAARRCPRGCGATLDAAVRSAGAIRDRFSVDGWARAQGPAEDARPDGGTARPGVDASLAMSVVLRKLSGFSGLVHENMVRGDRLAVPVARPLARAGGDDGRDAGRARRPRRAARRARCRGRDRRQRHDPPPPPRGGDHARHGRRPPRARRGQPARGPLPRRGDGRPGRGDRRGRSRRRPSRRWRGGSPTSTSRSGSTPPAASTPRPCATLRGGLLASPRRSATPSCARRALDGPAPRAPCPPMLYDLRLRIATRYGAAGGAGAAHRPPPPPRRARRAARPRGPGRRSSPPRTSAGSALDFFGNAELEFAFRRPHRGVAVTLRARVERTADGRPGGRGRRAGRPAGRIWPALRDLGPALAAPLPRRLGDGARRCPPSPPGRASARGGEEGALGAALALNARAPRRDDLRRRGDRGGHARGRGLRGPAAASARTSRTS